MTGGGNQSGLDRQRRSNQGYATQPAQCGYGQHQHQQQVQQYHQQQRLHQHQQQNQIQPQLCQRGRSPMRQPPPSSDRRRYLDEEDDEEDYEDEDEMEEDEEDDIDYKNEDVDLLERSPVSYSPQQQQPSRCRGMRCERPQQMTHQKQLSTVPQQPQHQHQHQNQSQHQHQNQHQPIQSRQHGQLQRYGSGGGGDSYGGPCPRLRAVSLDGAADSTGEQHREHQHACQNRPHHKHQQIQKLDRNCRQRRFRDVSPLVCAGGCVSGNGGSGGSGGVCGGGGGGGSGGGGGGGAALSSDANSCGSINNSGWCDDATYECRSRLRGRPPGPPIRTPPQLQQQSQCSGGGYHRPSMRQQQQQQHPIVYQSYRHTGRKYPDPEQARIYAGSSHANNVCCESRGSGSSGAYATNASSSGVVGWGGGFGGSGGGGLGVGGGVGGGVAGGGGGSAGSGANGRCGGTDQRCRHQVQLVIQVTDCGCGAAGGGSLTEDHSCEQAQQLSPSAAGPSHQRHRINCRPVWGADGGSGGGGGGGGFQDDGGKTQVHRVTIPCCCRVKPSR